MCPVDLVDVQPALAGRFPPGAGRCPDPASLQRGGPGVGVAGVGSEITDCVALLFVGRPPAATLETPSWDVNKGAG